MARNLFATLSTLALLIGTVVGISAVTPGNAGADPCLGIWSIGIGGLTTTGPGITGQDSAYIIANQRVGYNSADPQSGANEINRLVRSHRAQCPRDHILILAHSGGALAAHTWVSQTQSFPNLNVVLLADPKRAPGPGGPGFSAVPPMSWLPYPYSGADANFGTIPVLSVCSHDDHICDSNAGWLGYATGVHVAAYDFNASHYSPTATGVIYR